MTHQLHRGVIEASLALASVSALENVGYATLGAAKEGVQKFKLFSLLRDPAVFCRFYRAHFGRKGLALCCLFASIRSFLSFQRFALVRTNT